MTNETAEKVTREMARRRRWQVWERDGVVSVGDGFRRHPVTRAYGVAFVSGTWEDAVSYFRSFAPGEVAGMEARYVEVEAQKEVA